MKRDKKREKKAWWEVNNEGKMGVVKGKRQKNQEEAEISGSCLTSLIASFNKLG